VSRTGESAIPLPRAAPVGGPPGGFGLLLAMKVRIIRNRARQMAEDAPLRVVLIGLFVVAIWLTLYLLFDRIFLTLTLFPEQRVVIVQYVFHIFFAAMTVLLAFSSAILAYGGLFVRQEPAWLLASPIEPRCIVGMVLLESVFYASWSLLLLGLPMAVAVGRIEGLPWYFYLTFAAAFLAFVPIPGAIGLVAAWAAAMWMPRSVRRLLMLVAGTLIVVLLVWWSRLWDGLSAREPDRWLDRFLSELHVMRGALLPSTWVTKAIRNVRVGDPHQALFYLYVTVAHAAFLSWAAILLVARYLPAAFGRAGAAPAAVIRFGEPFTRRLTDVLFCYLPRQMRGLVLKDLRTFLRDPLQWSQLAILLGLLALYLAYLPRLHPRGFALPWQGLICFLNYGAITLIVSTFTSRFVYPLISLEGRQMWLVSLWPLSRASVVWAKFDFALAVTAGAALAVTGLSIRALQMPLVLGLVQVASTLSICVGLCGMAVGLGARLPSYEERSAARIAGSVGGTVNLVASLALVLLSISLMGALCYRNVYVIGDQGRLDAINLALYLSQIVIGFGSGAACMRIGIRHFERAEF
jgi:ABC-2 type transport system permease protein